MGAEQSYLKAYENTVVTLELIKASVERIEIELSRQGSEREPARKDSRYLLGLRDEPSVYPSHSNSISHWIGQMKRYLRFNGINDEDAIYVLPLYLDDEPLEWFNEYILQAKIGSAENLYDLLYMRYRNK
ncbi:hypothetical protein F4703DRAFT_1789966 [Phycomyces blakesleeanus]|uniref:Uncharacterized protein n=1 Tax=Phycomyces blakesleeanus (strain ATCC 8743b / DSM 1359 / FGSC 10004 / NBRC 33097 / NRRL 1555) TaxID=763407 RepID=A0A167PW89_PHYB8|nr:hypothetical protein PHYBLDRAFT_163740 [Phycomyces blakesleeanus NRRL 1555(-)]OAD78646.1 hypothetical protein PHYBLDRAFT_163740 [Phycomyces blakesleeanus NRRL 1555(-)]|eukprot:XP_018296686.1 hypothetical protein PHYBLDRAFT_163740 [Phycomyces blakesleeanus NRRL 1555(-)]